MMAKTNEPIKQDSSMHVPVLVFTIIFWGCLAVGAAGMDSFIGTVGAVLMIVFSYLIYLIVSCCCSDVRGYMLNMKAFDDYKTMYDGMVNGKGYFSFWIQCYHY